jgi:hypothetical protein
MMMTWLVSLSDAGALSGAPWVRAYQPQTNPIVWLVEPLGVIASTALLRLVQL